MIMPQEKNLKILSDRGKAVLILWARHQVLVLALLLTNQMVLGNWALVCKSGT